MEKKKNLFIQELIIIFTFPSPVNCGTLSLLLFCRLSMIYIFFSHFRESYQGTVKLNCPSYLFISFPAASFFLLFIQTETLFVCEISINSSFFFYSPIDIE